MDNILYDYYETLNEAQNISSTDYMPVEYVSNDNTCIFKYILFFTNSRDSNKNKTLKNMKDAIANIKGNKPKLYVFVAEKVKYKYKGGDLTISDDKEEIVISDNNKYDTLVFSRLGTLSQKNCKVVVKLLEERGILVLNPVSPSKTACDKFETYELLDGIVPQPSTISMTKDILDNKEMFVQEMKKIYKKFSGKGDKDKEFEFVVKILDGHGGTGVSLVNGKEILSVLQTMFAIDKKRTLLIQGKEDADGGDIRVHVLTFRDRQVILAAMKRVKIKSDFRSNVSLGASAKKVKLTKDQEQIALRAAKVSKLPWCAVDIMPLKKDLNNPERNNVVLEVNSSPGTAGISEVLGENFINILLSSLSNPEEFQIKHKEIGYKESGSIMFKNNTEPIELTIKLDTGNGSKTPHIEVGEYEETDGYVSFELKGEKLKFKKVGVTKSIVGDQVIYRPNIEIFQLKIGDRVVRNIVVSIVKERDKSTNMLLNRDTIKNFGYSINPDERFLETEALKKRDFIIYNNTNQNKSSKEDEEE